MLHDRFDRWGLGIASSSSAANRENPGRRWRSPPLIPRNIIYPTTPNRKFLEFSFLSEDQKFSSLNVLNLRHEDGIAFERRKIENGFSGHFGSMKPPKVSPSALPLQIEFKYSRKAIEM